MKKTITLLLLLALCAGPLAAQRIDQTINSAWRFQKGDITTPVESLNTTAWEIVNLPHTWNAEDAFDETEGIYRGVGWYVRELSVPDTWEGKTVFLKFEGANQTSALYLNGKKLGEHIGGYNAFGFDLSADLNYGERNTLAVKVDNSHNEDIPPLRADFTFYGGIYRNVRLIITEPVHFDLLNDASDGVFVQTPTVNTQSATLTVNGNLVNTTSQRKNVTVETTIVDAEQNVVAVKTSRVRLAPNSNEDFSHEGLSITSPNLWSPDSPYLYSAIVSIREDGSEAPVTDQLVLPVGLRWFTFDDQGGFQLNGQPLKLIGANRHQDFPNFGNALTDDYHINDYTQIKEMGFNFVRLAHYPQAPEVYRICDELGLLVWSEIPVISSLTVSGGFSQNSLNMQREHIRQTRNHPSILMYGYMNEIFLAFQFNRRLSEEDRAKVAAATVQLARELEALTKEEAPNHYSVMAAHRHTSYNEYGLTEIPDVVGWNLYFGWYYDRIEDLTGFLADQHARYPDQRMIVSEYGPGADVRIHARKPSVQDFSEDFQFKLHASYLKQMMEMPYLAGFAAWNFADFGSTGRADAIPNINQKGLVNFDRSEKDVCGLYRAYFKEEPIVHIASRNFTRRAAMEDTEGAAICTDTIRIFTNQAQIELSFNGQSLGTRPVQDKEVTFAVPFTNGQNILTAVGEAGASDELAIDYRVIPTSIASVSDLDLAINVGSQVSFYDPGAQVLWIPDRKYSAGSWGYVGGAPYTVQRRQLTTGISQDIKGTDCNPLFQTFVEGITGYQFDVPDGRYEVTLHFTEHITRRQQEQLLFTLSNDNAAEDAPEPRQFDVDINGTNVIAGLNLEEDYGSRRAVTFNLEVGATNGEGIVVAFRPESGQGILSGIRIRSTPSGL